MGWQWYMVEIVNINTILQQYQAIFLIHKIQNVVSDDGKLSLVIAMTEFRWQLYPFDAKKVAISTINW